MENADGVVDGEAEDGASAGAERDVAGYGEAVHGFDLWDGNWRRMVAVVVAGLAGAGGESDCGAEREHRKREARC